MEHAEDCASKEGFACNCQSDLDEERQGAMLVTQLRILDVLYALLTDTSPDKAKHLMELHAKGAILGSSPVFTGNFVFDEQNGDLRVDESSL